MDEPQVRRANFFWGAPIVFCNAEAKAGKNLSLTRPSPVLFVYSRNPVVGSILPDWRIRYINIYTLFIEYFLISWDGFARLLSPK